MSHLCRNRVKMASSAVKPAGTVLPVGAVRRVRWVHIGMSLLHLIQRRKQSFKVLTTNSICSARSSGYMGRDRNSRAQRSATGKEPWRAPEKSVGLLQVDRHRVMDRAVHAPGRHPLQHAVSILHPHRINVIDVQAFCGATAGRTTRGSSASS